MTMLKKCSLALTIITIAGIMSCAQAIGALPAKHTKVLIVLTSHDTLGNTGRETGYYLEELTHPLYALIDAREDFDIASPMGGKAPMDPKSKKVDDPLNKKFLDDRKLVFKVEHTLKLADVKAKDYGAILFPGGHGPMWDLAENKDSEKLVREIYEHGGVVAAVCHGPAGIANVKLANGKYLVSGKNVTGFTNEEEQAVSLDKAVPFLLESKLIEHGAHFEKAPLWQEKVVVDGQLITGQNPKSAAKLGQQLAQALRAPH